MVRSCYGNTDPHGFTLLFRIYCKIHLPLTSIEPITVLFCFYSRWLGTIKEGLIQWFEDLTMSLLIQVRPSSWTQTVYQLATKKLTLGQCCFCKYVGTVPTPPGQRSVALIGSAIRMDKTTGKQAHVIKRFMATPQRKTKQVAERAPGTGQREVSIGRKGLYCYWMEVFFYFILLIL